MTSQTSDMMCVYPAMLARVPFVPVSRPKGNSVTYKDGGTLVMTTSRDGVWPFGKNPRYFIMAICHALQYEDHAVVVDEENRTVRFECSPRGVYTRMGVQQSIHDVDTLRDVLKGLSSMEITVKSEDKEGIPGYIRETKATTIFDPDGTEWVGDKRCACVVKLTSWAWEQFNDPPVFAYKDEVEKLGNSARAMDVYLWARSYEQRGRGLRCTVRKMRDIMGGDMPLRSFRNVMIRTVKTVNNASRSFCLSLGREAILGRVLKNPRNDRPDIVPENQWGMEAPTLVRLMLPYGCNQALDVVSKCEGLPPMMFLRRGVIRVVEEEISALLNKVHPRQQNMKEVRLDKAMVEADALRIRHTHSAQCPYVVACVSERYGNLLSRETGIDGESPFGKACGYFAGALSYGMDEEDALLFTGAKMLEYGMQHASELNGERSHAVPVSDVSGSAHVHSADCSHVRAVGERVFGDVLFESGGAAVFDGLCGRLAGLWNASGDGADAVALAEEVLANFEG